jgi:hypothetical protein
VVKKLDSMIKYRPFLAAKVAPKGETGEESDLVRTSL